MKCIMCFEKFGSEINIPMVLECGHSFCDICLKNLIKKNPACCPTCNTSITPSFDHYKKNFALIDFISSKNSTICPNSHELSYEKQSSLIYQKIYGDLLLKCSHCEKTWEGKSWHCFKCRFVLCKSCYDDQLSSKIAQNVSVHLNFHPDHKLYNYLNAASYVKNHFKMDLNCSICNIKMLNGAVGCRACKFYICENCNNRNLTIKVPLCEFHNLELRQDNLEIIRDHQLICNICDLSISNQCYKCPACNYKICMDCYIYYTTHYCFELECANNHPLYLSFPFKYYSRFHASEIKCDSCEEKFSDQEIKMFHCRKCKFDICQECFSVYYNYRKDARKVLCYNGHRVNVENLKDDDEICAQCRNKIKKFLLFYCEECDEYYCPKHTRHTNNR
ncbi:hypothetical protein SteCoe_25428 [Stentor coeruleus]|uniref:RING-type domain-containing protein n=1 Tax=Stentor coeruleus TaxID=5963 RepID=A0A1R2BF68_9CILI|nr:hypothetical protein SteCoe_25428 [Stentor coeruleus]